MDGGLKLHKLSAIITINSKCTHVNGFTSFFPGNYITSLSFKRDRSNTEKYWKPSKNEHLYNKNTASSLHSQYLRTLRELEDNVRSLNKIFSCCENIQGGLGGRQFAGCRGVGRLCEASVQPPIPTYTAKCCEEL